MTEAEWLTSADPAAMLAWLTQARCDDLMFPRVPPTDRKLRLFACAVWRGHPAILARYGGSDLPEISERMADGEATEADIARARERIGLDVDGGGLPYPTYVRQAARHMARVLVGKGNTASEERRQSALLQCVFGNPFRAAPSLGWLEEAYGRSAENVVCTAQAIYAENRWGDLGILADALEEAGCPSEPCPACPELGWGHEPVWTAAIPLYWCGQCDERTRCVPNPLLAHLRGPGPHARGCWVVDLLLGKE